MKVSDDIAAVAEALRKVSKGKLDAATVDYAAAIVTEDRESSLSELIGPFFLDCGAASTNEEVEVICLTLRGLIREGNEEGEGEGGECCSNKQQQVGTAEKLQAPVRLGELMEEHQGGYSDPFLGIKCGCSNVNFNSNVSITETLKLHKQLQRERDRQLKLMREWERQKAPLPPPKRKHGDSTLSKVTDVIVDKFSVAVGGRELLKDAALKLVMGRIYGLAGRNGIGKSTFLGALVRQEISGVNPDISIGCVEQEITWLDKSALQSVLDVDEERSALMEEEEQLSATVNPSDQVGRRLTFLYERLEFIDAKSAEHKASTILSGLGFTETMQRKPVKSLSGGWRMRVSLARALFADPDIMLLDEPTNHLDLQAVAWLTEYLHNWTKTAIIVSHARDFLNAVCTDMLHFTDQSLFYYRGNYDTFEQSRIEKLRQQQRQFDAQEAKVKNVQQFIDKFRYNAKRASLVQSRIKALSKLPMLEAVSDDPSLCFKFGTPESLPTPLLELKDASFSYSLHSEKKLKERQAAADYEERRDANNNNNEKRNEDESEQQQQQARSGAVLLGQPIGVIVCLAVATFSVTTVLF
eukprot:GHVS01076449.1.p1 GENE.GHVS01076449.1~~GHVS01076449.1.p1  ORF type:complete len:582 (+),score=73.17 GHVS01076449.1:119-1864(+)